MRYLLMGGGQQGRAIAFDLLRDPDAEVIIADNDVDQLEDVVAWLDSSRVDAEPIDARRRDECRAAMDDIDVTISALPYVYNVDLTEDAIATGTHFVDLGGNHSVVQAQLELDTQARDAGITVIPDLGLAPGLAVILAADACDRMTRVDQLRIRVGGLPQKAQGTLQHMLTYNTEGLLNRYSEPVLAVRNGENVTLEPLTESETVRFPEPFGELEAVLTSGGISSLPRTMGHKVENMDYKTLRYPGHCAIMRSFFELGLFDRQPRKLADGREIVPRQLLGELVESTSNYQEADAVLMRISAEGVKNNTPITVRMQIIDRFDKEYGITAMMRMTGFPTAIIAAMIARGEIDQRGVVPAERSVPRDPFRAELKLRDIQLEEVVRVV